jgi:hypothetical protein
MLRDTRALLLMMQFVRTFLKSLATSLHTGFIFVKFVNGTNVPLSSNPMGHFFKPMGHEFARLQVNNLNTFTVYFNHTATNNTLLFYGRNFSFLFGGI